MRREPVKSGAVNSVGYDPRRRELAVEYREGAVYYYLGVPEGTYCELMTAESIGKFVTARIKPNFRFRRQRGKRR